MDHQKVRRSLNEIYGAQIPFVPNTNRVGQVKSGAGPTKIFYRPIQSSQLDKDKSVMSKK